MKTLDRQCGRNTYSTAVVRRRMLKDTEETQQAWRSLLAERIIERLTAQDRQVNPAYVRYWIMTKESNWRELTVINGCDAVMISYTRKYEAEKDA